jgi:anti-sigma factor RsiW
MGRITCRQLVELVTEYLEGTLGAGDRARFEAHLRGCSLCARYLEQMRKTIELAGRLREEDLTPSMRETLLGAFREWKARPAAGA